MNRKNSKLIAELITNEQIARMFEKAKAGIEDWSVVSAVNKGMTKGAAWNILTKAFDVDKRTHILAKTNMVREFGDFIKDEFDLPKKTRKKIIPHHQEPVFGV
jgi:hypothetical protein